MLSLNLLLTEKGCNITLVELLFLYANMYLLNGKIHFVTGCHASATKDKLIFD